MYIVPAASVLHGQDGAVRTDATRPSKPEILPCCGHSLPTPDLYQPHLNRDALSTVLKVPIVSVGICALSFSVRCFRSTVRWHLLLEEDETASSQLFRRHFLAGSPGCSEGCNYNAVTSGDVTVSGDVSSACRELGKDFQRTHFSWSKKEEVRYSSVKKGEAYFRKSTTGMHWVGSNGWGGRACGQAGAGCSLTWDGARRSRFGRGKRELFSSC